MNFPFDKKKYEAAILAGQIVWRKHALEKLISRGISRYEVLDVALHGELIQTYLEDKPYPSILLLGFAESRPLHVVLSFNDEDSTVFIITTYEPDTKVFNPDFKTKRN
ncbi:MAG: DUF4258 domain-containing protein [Chitinophagales bacterium]|nr:DUF4258 domain-containing protein [Chitinophagales bacterium]